MKACPSKQGYSTAAGEVRRLAEGWTGCPHATWGLQATGAAASPYDGTGVRIAILGGGIHVRHPDFVGRQFRWKSFVPGEQPDQDTGWTTHLVGTVCGTRRASGVQHYGIAPAAEIFIGKVIDRRGLSTSQRILEGTAWAIHHRCDVILVYFNADTHWGAFNDLARRALGQGILIIAAASPNARRTQGQFGYVGFPGNATSVMAVGGIGQAGQLASFSPRSQVSPWSHDAAKVDLVGPAVDVFSAFGEPPVDFRFVQGTSRAAAHAAGIAALWAQATGHRGHASWQTMIANCRRLELPSVDVGAGLVQAPGHRYQAGHFRDAGRIDSRGHVS